MHYIIIWGYLSTNLGFSGGTSSKEPTWKYRRCKKHGLIPGSGRCPGGEHGNLFQHFCLKNHTDRGAWLTTVHKVANNLNGWACTHAHPLTPTGSWLKVFLGRMYSTPHVGPAVYNCETAGESGSQRKPNSHSSVQFSCSVMSDFFRPHGLQHQWSHPIISPCHPLLLPPSIFPSIRVFSNESLLRIRWPNYWSFNFSISSSNEYSGLIIL